MIFMDNGLFSFFQEILVNLVVAGITAGIMYKITPHIRRRLTRARMDYLLTPIGLFVAFGVDYPGKSFEQMFGILPSCQLIIHRLQYLFT